MKSSPYASPWIALRLIALETGCGRFESGALVLHVPVSVMKILMSQILGEHHQAMGQGNGLSAPSIDELCRQSVTQIIKTDIMPCPVALDSGDQTAECPIGVVRLNGLAKRADKEPISRWELSSTLVLVTLERPHSRLVQR
jgi:hypothetical protein